jgi:hypothetical protein
MMLRGVLAFLLVLPALAADDPRDIVVRSFQRDFQDQKIIRDYTFKILERTTEFDNAGREKSAHTHLREVLYFGGKPHRRLLEKDGKPLPPDEEQREQNNATQAAKEASKLTPAQIKKREDDAFREREKTRAELLDIPKAFDFTLLGEPTVNGRPAWQIKAEPRRDYHGRNAGILRNLRGTIWIDKKDLAWVRVEAESLDTISVGFFIARVAKGSAILLETQRINDEVWAISHISMKASARVALVKKFNIEEEMTYSDYKKFRTDATVTSVSDPK